MYFGCRKLEKDNWLRRSGTFVAPRHLEIERKMKLHGGPRSGGGRVAGQGVMGTKGVCVGLMLSWVEFRCPGSKSRASNLA